MAILNLGNNNSAFSGSFSGSFQGDGSSLTGVGGSTGAFGISDSSGEYTYYSSLSASMAAAVSGNVVEVFANTIVSGSDPLVDTILFKNGVNIFGNGYTYELNHSSSMAAFADYAAQNTTTGTDISCSINEFNIRRISSDASSKAILINNKTSGKQTSLNLHGSTIYSSEGITYNASYTYGTVDGGHFSGDTTGAGFQNNASSADTKPYVKNAHFHFPTGYSTVEYADNCQFIGETGTYALRATGRISNCYIYSKGSISANAGGSNAALLGCHVENGSSGIAARGFYRISDSTIISSTGFAVRTFGNANCELTNNRIYASGYVALDQYTSYSTGKHIISNNLIITDSTTYAACQLKGAPTNDFLFSNNTIFNRGDNANSHGVKLTNNGSSHQVYMANNTIKVFNASANCITAAASADAHLADNIYDFASVPLNAFVTQSFTNVPDEQGNIHLTSSLNNNRIYSGSFSGSFQGDGSSLTGVGGSSGKIGISDSNGTYTYYSTLSASLQAASEGDTIELFANVTENWGTSDPETHLKNNVNFNFNGHTYFFTGSKSAGGIVCLTDNSVPVSCSFYNGRIQFEEQETGGGNSNHLLTIASQGSRINFNAFEIENLHQDASPASYLIINYGTIVGGTYIARSNCSTYLINNRSTSTTAKAFLKNANIFYYGTSYAIYNYYSAEIQDCNIYYEGSSTAVYQANFSGMLRDSTIYCHSGNGVVGGEVIGCDMYIRSGYGHDQTTSGGISPKTANTYIEIATGDDQHDGIRATHEVSNCHVVHNDDGGGHGIELNGSSARLHSSMIVGRDWGSSYPLNINATGTVTSNVLIRSTYPANSQTAVYIASGVSNTMILDSIIEVAGSAGTHIGISAVDDDTPVKYTGLKFYNKSSGTLDPINETKISQAITSTTDPYGNLVIE